MANRILFRPTAIVLSSQIGDIEISTSNASVKVKIVGFGGIVMLEETFYALSGYVKIYNLASLIENNMRNSNYVLTDYTLTVSTNNTDTDTVTFSVLYCDRYTVCTEVDKFLSENFLTTLSARRIAPDDAIDLSLVASAGETVEYNISACYRTSSDATPQFLSYSTVGSIADKISVKTLNLPCSDIIENLANYTELDKADIELVSFTVSCGQRSASFFIDRQLARATRFAFRNCFNVFEATSILGVTTAKTDVSRTIAVVNGTSSFYDQQTTKTYEVEASDLTAPEAAWIDQMLSSYDVRTFVDNPCSSVDPVLLAQVLITDMTCEMQDGDEELNSVKFTWRFADNRPFVLLSASRDVFSSPYNIVFS